MAKKGKRCATGYNLYTKECALRTGDFKGCITNGKWKGLSDDKQAEWNKKAADQCVK